MSHFFRLGIAFKSDSASGVNLFLFVGNGLCHAGFDWPRTDAVNGDGFPTETRNARLVPAAIVSPDEMPDDEFPMILTTGRQLEHWHTGQMTRRSTILDTLEPQAIATLCSADMRRLNLTPGDRVRVSTRRGIIELHARVDGVIPEGMVFIPFCYAEAAANTLTNPALDPFGKIPEFKFCAARVEPAESFEAAE